jgi:Protein of unknown function with PCYCGC motif
MPTRALFLKPYWVLLIGIAVIVLAGCASASVATPGVDLPDFVREAPPSVKEAYQFAAMNPKEMEKYPCFCGCGKMGHTSNRSCYIKDISSDGTITWDNHAAGCGICVDITKDVMRLMKDGKTSREIRTYVDATYSSFGPSTNTAIQ